MEEWMNEEYNASAADVVEVVRCKDCKFSHHADPNDNHDEYICDWHERFYAKNSGLLWHSGDYCSYGERREHEQIR